MCRAQKIPTSIPCLRAQRSLARVAQQNMQDCYDYMEAFKRGAQRIKSSDGLHLTAISWIFALCKVYGTTGSGYC